MNRRCRWCASTDIRPAYWDDQVEWLCLNCGASSYFPLSVVEELSAKDES